MNNNDMAKIVRIFSAVIGVISGLFLYKGITQVLPLHSQTGNTWVAAMGVLFVLGLIGVFYKPRKKNEKDTDKA